VISPVRVQAALLALLACNTLYYIVAGRFSEALESVAWYALLILFLLETARTRHGASLLAVNVNHGLRLTATLAIAVSAVFYVAEKEWLDATNLLLWIAVVVLLEIEIRRPAAVAAHRKEFTLTAALLYTALGALAVVWLTRGEWMDAWDAVIWLTAFGVLELDLLHTSNKNIL
jgi:hypothetical protein